MKRASLVIVALGLTLLAAGVASAALDDPYQVLQRHFEAVGGLDKVKAEKTTYMQGEVTIVGTGLAGKFETWAAPPLNSRQEVDLGIFQQTSGSNDEFSWSVDANGKLQKHVDERTLEQRELAKLQAEYDFLDPASTHFKLELTGLETVGERTCYVVRVTNTINEDVSLQYFDTATFYQIKSTDIQPANTSHSEFSDWREVNGVVHSYRIKITVEPVNQVQEIAFSLIETNVAIDPAKFQPPGADVRDFRFTKGSSAENVPFELIEQHLFLPVTVNCLTRRWVLDSGAGSTVLDKSFAEELGLEIKGEIKGRGASNLVDVSFATVPPFTLPGIEFDSQKVVVIDLKELMHNIAGIDVVGILGYDFLSRFTTKIDYAAESISFYDPDSFKYVGAGTVIEAPVTQDNMFHVPLTVDGVHGGKWNLDLGAGGMDFHYPYAEAHGLLELKGVEHMGFGAGGGSVSREVRFNTIEFGGFTVNDITVAVPATKLEGAFGTKEITGNIGNVLLRRFVLYLDYKHGLVTVEKGAEFDSYVPRRDNSGLQVAYDNEDRIVVNFVSPGTPAAKAGLKEGDTILSFNGIAVEHFDGLLAVRNLLRSEPGTTLEVSYLRDSKPSKTKLTLRKLI